MSDALLRDDLELPAPRTALIVLERRIPLPRPVTVSMSAATYPGSSAGLYAGERLPVRALLYGMLLPSGNDAATALAESIAGTPARCVTLMNREALRLRLWHTRFATPTGYDAAGQVTTARDLARLARIAMQRPPFLSIVRTREWSTWDLDRRVFQQWENLNKLLWMSSAVDGVKTGTTPAAGACLVSSARKDHKWVIEVNLGSSAESRFSDGAQLLDYGLPLATRLPTAD